MRDFVLFHELPEVVDEVVPDINVVLIGSFLEPQVDQDVPLLQKLVLETIEGSHVDVVVSVR